MTNTKFKFDILENTEEGIVQVGEKEVYNLDGGEVVDLQTYLKENQSARTELFPHFSSGLNVSQKSKYKTSKDAISVFVNNGACVELNGQTIFLINGLPNANYGNVVISKDTLSKIVSGFCARRLIESNPFNCKDEYMKPSDDILTSDNYQQWSNDCLIYSLFDNQSFQSSLRQVDYQGKKWDIKNQFFPFRSKLLQELSQQYEFIEMIDDLDEDSSERFVYTEIERIKTEEITFSKYALELLDYSECLLRESFPYRKMMHNQHEEYHLHSWDAFYAQLKIVLKQYMPEQFKVLDGLRKALADKLRPKVYEFGFLYK